MLPGLNVVLCDLGQGAQVLPAQGRQEHDERQVDGRVVAPRDQLTVGEILCPDGGDDLPCFIHKAGEPRQFCLERPYPVSDICCAWAGSLGRLEAEVGLALGSGPVFVKETLLWVPEF